MYSVVLATMITAGSATPAWHHHHSWHGCHGCYSSCYCSYSCYAGYSGYCSSCYGCYSCYSSCHHGYYRYCSSYCHCSSYVYSCSTCCSYYCSAPVVIYSSPCCGGAVIRTPEVVPVPSKKAEQAAPAPAPASTARVTVSLPSDAKLWVDNVECPLTSSVRSFNTPALNSNQQYVYNLKVEVVRDGRAVSETQRVVITPGQETRVDFNNSAVVGSAAR